MSSRWSHRRFALAVALLVALAPAGCGRAPSGGDDAEKRTDVGLVFDVGGRGDKSFNDAAYRGLERARDELGVKFQEVETGEGSDREPALRQLAAGDPRLVFGVGFLFTDDIRSIAEEFPSKHFACIDYSLKEGEVLPPNLVALKFKEEEGSFLVGAIAGLLTKTDKVGFVGGMEIPLIKKFEAGYLAGVRYVNPDCQVIVKYAGATGNAFKDPTKGKELALAIYGAGADIIYHASGSTGLGVFEAAREKGTFAIGVDSDQHDEAPGRILTSMVKRVDVAVFDTIRDDMQSGFQGGVHVFGLAEDGVGYVFDDRNRNLVTDDVHTRVEQLKADIIAGKIVVPSQ
jgi:basic membrane protein A